MPLRFGDFELSAETRLLTQRGRPVPLTPKAFQLLELLIRRRPAVVTKLEIQDVVWPNTFVLEANVANLIAEIRTALGDSARKSRYVRTASGTGYAFDEPVVEYTQALPAIAPHRPLCSLTGDEHSLLLTEGEHLIGRSEQCDLTVRSSTVSRLHARVTVRGKTAVIEDLGSRNGTFVRGERLTAPAELKAGDDVRVGVVVLSFRVLDPDRNTDEIPMIAPAPLPPRADETQSVQKPVR